METPWSQGVAWRGQGSWTRVDPGEIPIGHERGMFPHENSHPWECPPQSGNSFHVFDQGQFAKEVLPKYFKHNNMASFVRQLNMYGFRKVVHIEQGGLVKPEKDDTEFQHPYFIRGQEHLLENIKRKVTSVSSIKNEDIKVRQDNVTKLLTDIQVMKGKQESMDSKLIAMKHENEALWREVASLRQKHAQQQKVVNKLIQFLISLVQSNRILGVKRKIPLMLNDSSSAHSMPKYSRQYSLEHVHGSSPYAASSPAYSGSNLYSPDSSANSGPIISDVTELAQSSPSASPSGSLDESLVSWEPGRCGESRFGLQKEDAFAGPSAPSRGMTDIPGAELALPCPYRLAAQRRSCGKQLHHPVPEHNSGSSVPARGGEEPGNP
ncbi:heat shock factor protein 1 isoform X2 [Egretta garzetta]|uniref:heat shock factor protein 1 isoform X2 n=1 Tax=Egretta garzetta TaxID=188379 RepID=UPI00163B642C|nr:heat shock factor protein 1 isoform X2 [Egretta garzetta]